MRNKKAVTLIISVALFAAYMWFCSSWATFMEKLLMNGEAVAEVFEKYLFPFYHFGKAALSGNVISLLLFLLCTVIPFALAYAVIKTNYVHIMTANRGEKRKKYREKYAKSNGVKAALAKKEIARYLSSPMYILNASAGVILMVIMSVALLINGRELFMVLDVFGISSAAPAAVSAALCLCASMVVISAPSVSVEGKNLWLIKSLPIRAFDALEAKAICHIAATIPFVLLSAIICTIALKATVWQSIQMFTLPAAIVAFCAYLGVTVNLLFPKFDWISEVHCVKQSTSVVITMFGVMALVAALAVVYAVILRNIISADLCVLLYTVLLLAGGLLLRQWLKKRGSRIFEGLQG